MNHDSPTEWRELREQRLTGERALFASRRLRLQDCIFADGESPLKESADIELTNCSFQWKYPLWYGERLSARGCTWQEMARAGVWYSRDVRVEDSLIEAPKNFRRCQRLSLSRVHFPHAAETLWHCDEVQLSEVQACGDYFGMNSTHLTVDKLSLSGNYPFDGCRDVQVSNSRLNSRDAFWNCERVTVRHSYVCGEYLGWNSRDLTFEDCTLESLQGLCYIDRLVLRNCKLLNTTLAFEYSSVDADICSGIDSVLNPTSGTIRAARIGELILQRDRIDPGKTTIICREAD